MVYPIPVSLWIVSSHWYLHRITVRKGFAQVGYRRAEPGGWDSDLHAEGDLVVIISRNSGIRLAALMV